MEGLPRIYFWLLPIVLSAALVEGFWLSRREANGYDWKAWASSLADMIGRQIIALLPVGLATPFFALAYQHRFFTIHLDNLGAVVMLFVGVEFFYYWYHRTSHTVRWFWATHAVHHSPNQLTLATAYRLGWTGKVTGTTLFFTPLALLGFEPATIITTVALNLLYQFWLHAAWIPRLGWIEGVFNTPSSHRVHHARNPVYLDANFGGVLVVFDRLFGTYVAERADEPCDYGLVTRVTSYNPVTIAFHAWVSLAKDLAGARSLREVLLYLFGRPGWRPDGEGLTTEELRRRRALSHPAMT